jgi:thiamine biosynthesis lipoprotein
VKAVLFAFAGAALACATTPSLPPEAGQRLERRSRVMMGTLVQIGAEGGGAPAFDAAFAAFEKIEATLNEWKETSPLGRVNRGAGGPPVEVPLEVFEAVARAIGWAERSGGAFDPTWAALWPLWRFDRPPRVPSREEVEALRAHVGFGKVRLDRAALTVQLPEKGMQLGLGGIAKGTAVDLAAAALRAHGVARFLIEAGGDVYAGGPFRVAVKDPRDPERALGALDLRDEALSASGDYERFFEVDGVRYHHIIDPRTGFPARAARGTAVVARSSEEADALATALFVMGPEGLALARGAGAQALVVDAEGRVQGDPNLLARLGL